MVSNSAALARRVRGRRIRRETAGRDGSRCTPRPLSTRDRNRGGRPTEALAKALPFAGQRARLQRSAQALGESVGGACSPYYMCWRANHGNPCRRRFGWRAGGQSVVQPGVAIRSARGDRAAIHTALYSTPSLVRPWWCGGLLGSTSDSTWGRPGKRQGRRFAGCTPRCGGNETGALLNGSTRRLGELCRPKPSALPLLPICAR